MLYNIKFFAKVDNPLFIKQINQFIYNSFHWMQKGKTFYSFIYLKPTYGEKYNTLCNCL